MFVYFYLFFFFCAQGNSVLSNMDIGIKTFVIIKIVIMVIV